VFKTNVLLTMPLKVLSQMLLTLEEFRGDVGHASVGDELHVLVDKLRIKRQYFLEIFQKLTHRFMGQRRLEKNRPVAVGGNSATL